MNMQSNDVYHSNVLRFVYWGFDIDVLIVDCWGAQSFSARTLGPAQGRQS